jgi:T-complex protein 1 subunit theta
LYVADKEESPIATIVIRGSTENIMDDIERAVDDGVNTFKALTKVRKKSVCPKNDLNETLT